MVAGRHVELAISVYARRAPAAGAVIILKMKVKKSRRLSVRGSAIHFPGGGFRSLVGRSYPSAKPCVGIWPAYARHRLPLPAACACRGARFKRHRRKSAEYFCEARNFRDRRRFAVNVIIFLVRRRSNPLANAKFCIGFVHARKHHHNAGAEICPASAR